MNSSGQVGAEPGQETGPAWSLTKSVAPPAQASDCSWSWAGRGAPSWGWGRKASLQGVSMPLSGPHSGCSCVNPEEAAGIRDTACF